MADQDDSIHSERRSSARHVVYFPVKLRSAGGAERLCVCHDMSSTGGMMMTQTKLDVGQRVQVSLYLPNDRTGPRTIDARIVRVAHRSDHNRFWMYDAAMEFDGTHNEMEPTLEELSQHQARGGLG